MSTSTLTPAPRRTTATAAAAPPLSLRRSVEQTFTMAHRSLIKILRKPEEMFDVILQPILFTVMFTFIFGGAVAGSIGSYLPMIIPGILAQTMISACMSVGTGIREDMEKGVFDRFRSLPMSRIAPLAGPMIADLIRYLIATVLTFAVGFALGYRPSGGALGVVGAGLLVIVSAWALSWIFVFLGTVARSARAVQAIGMMILFPLTFLSNAFVSPDTMPDWLRAFVQVNPVSHLVSAVRDLCNGGGVTIEVFWTVVCLAVVVAVFAPLALWGYRRRT
ncbi:transport permease protein [Tersicoccus solisilvae]|uniref:Transport permease protein n=1 Tax=Tersicoccus solisilvae TaxID=1882339 RepID=A0ABQ1NRW1_9MICC|nr:ABC transporter permease [Tersicoccus solisilvae]GGC83976.1 transport permease protein [Tersicoccus solisilvae]